MRTPCPHCGHDDHVSNDEHDHGVGVEVDSVPIVPDIGVAPRPDTQHVAVARPRRGLPRRLVIGGIVLLGALALFLLARGGGDDAAIDEPGVADQGRSVGNDDDASTTETGSADGVSSPDSVAQGAELGGGDPNFPPSDLHLLADSVADVFRLRVDGDQKYAVVYPSPMGLQILSADGWSSPALEVAVGFEEAARLPLLSDGSQTWAINPDDLDTAYLVSTQFVVVDIGLEGSVAFINSSLEPVNVGISSFGAWGPGFDVPVGSDILAVPGRGLLILPATGGTFRLRARGVERVSEDRAVAAGLSSEVYQVCDEQLSCELYVTGVESEERIDLDVEVASQVHISPDGDYVLTTSEEHGVEIITVANGVRWSLGSRPIHGAAWSPDGTFVALSSGDEMVLAFPEGRRVEELTLPIESASPVVLVVSSPA